MHKKCSFCPFCSSFATRSSLHELISCARNFSLARTFLYAWLVNRPRKLTFRALVLRQRDWRNRGLCVELYAENGATLLVGIWWREDKNTVRIKSADLEDNFFSRVLRLSDLPRCRERPQTAICCLERLGRLRCLATGLDTSLAFLST